MAAEEGVRISLREVADVLDEFFEDALERRQDDLIVQAAGRLVRLFKEQAKSNPLAIWDDKKISEFCRDFGVPAARITMKS